jgi:hypothetical protein
MNARSVIGLALVLLAGCSFQAAKIDEAKGYVQQALELWQKGGKPDELKSRTPPIEFHEAKWNAGEKLVNFDIGAVQFISRDNVVRCETRLTVRSPKGKERTESVVFDVVSLAPNVKIVNNPMP